MCVKSVVHIFIGSLGSFGSAVDDKGANEPNEPARLWMLKSGPVFCSLAGMERNSRPRPRQTAPGDLSVLSSSCPLHKLELASPLTGLCMCVKK